MTTIIKMMVIDISDDFVVAQAFDHTSSSASSFYIFVMIHLFVLYSMTFNNGIKMHTIMAPGHATSGQKSDVSGSNCCRKMLW